MTIKIALLSTQDQIISDIKELVSDDDKIVAYMFKNPHRITLDRPLLIEGDGEDDRTVQVSLAPWILATKDKECPVSPNNVITLVDPLDSVKEMYEEKVNADN